MQVPLIELILRGLATVDTPDQQSDRSSKERIAVLLDQADRLKQLTREIVGRVEKCAIEIIDQHGDIEVGDIRWYVGVEKTVKCIDKAKTLDALLAAAAGDLENVCLHFSSDPFKHGACKGTLGDVYNGLFKTEEDKDLKEGKPVRGLKKFDKKVEQFKQPTAPKET